MLSLVVTKRAIGLLTVAFLRHTATAFFCVLYPGDLAESPSFRIIRQVLPLRWWALVFALVSMVLLVGIAFGREMICRVGLAFSAALTGCWLTAFVATIYVYGVPPSPMLPVAWAALLAKDLIISSGPLIRPKAIVLPSTP